MTPTPDAAGRAARRLLLRAAAEGRTDGELLRRFAVARDETAFAELVRRHGPIVLAACRRVVSDPEPVHDAFQATFLVLARKAGSLARHPSVAGWLYEVARRCALKARGRSPRPPEPCPDAEAAGAPDPVAEAERRELAAAVEEEVRRLPAAYREAVVLHHLEGLGYAEAAVRLGCPVGTLAARLTRARQWLRRRLARRGWGAEQGLATLAAAAGPAALPCGAGALAATARAAMLGQGAALAPGVSSLYQGMMTMMLLSKLKGIASVVAGMGLLGAVSLAVAQAPSDRSVETAPVPLNRAESPPQPGPAVPGSVPPVPEPERLRQQYTELLSKRAQQMSLEQLRREVQRAEAAVREGEAEEELRQIQTRLEELAKRYPATRAAQAAGRALAAMRAQPETTMDRYGLGGSPAYNTPTYD
ncbi:MAG TPA: sigma-70 family RNA polymerase sigma factor, partial [Gemmataceae bacterium]